MGNKRVWASLSGTKHSSASRQTLTTGVPVDGRIDARACGTGRRGAAGNNALTGATSSARCHTDMRRTPFRAGACRNAKTSALLLAVVVVLFGAPLAAALACPPGQTDVAEAGAAVFQCGGSCACEAPLYNATGGTLSSGVYANNAACSWIVGGVSPAVTFTAFETEGCCDKAVLDECDEASCASPGAVLATRSGKPQTLNPTP